MSLIELEQTIISGVDDSMKEASEKKILKGLLKMIRKLSRKEDIIRLLGIYISCYSLPKQEFREILKIVDNEEEKEIL